MGKSKTSGFLPISLQYFQQQFLKPKFGVKLPVSEKKQRLPDDKRVIRHEGVRDGHYQVVAQAGLPGGSDRDLTVVRTVDQKRVNRIQ